MKHPAEQLTRSDFYREREERDADSIRPDWEVHRVYRQRGYYKYHVIGRLADWAPESRGLGPNFSWSVPRLDARYFLPGERDLTNEEGNA